MSTRDPRSGNPQGPSSAREPTVSLEPDDDVAHPPFASGTHRPSDEKTRVESPGAQRRPPTEHPQAATPALDESDERIGTMLGSYRVEELLGKGGMGFVYRAEHTKLGREVALKLLRADYAKRKDAVARFIQEARTVNRIRHRNIVDVPDIIELEDGTTCIIMEYLRGERLGIWARRGVELPRAIAVLMQICEGLAAAHAVDVVHRDLKPDNVFVVPTGDGAELVKLLDFGVAKLLNRDEEEIGFQTAAGSVVGTPAYMSPEQAGGMLVDARSDIYSLGAIMYELFCGQPMFKGRSFGEYVRKHLTEHPVPPRQTPHGGAIDARLEALIMRALAKDPNERFQHISEVRDALLAMLANIEPGTQAFAQVGAEGLINPPTLHTINTLNSRPSNKPAFNARATTGPRQALTVEGAPSSPMMIPPTAPYHAPPSGMPWPWVIVGGLAVCAATLAIVWVARDTKAPSPVPPAPTPQVAAEPRTPTPATTPIKPISLTFVANVAASGVFIDGETTAQCQTPCTVDVMPPAAGASLARKFRLRKAGYVDATIVVDLNAPRDRYALTLEPIAVATEPPVDTSSTKHKTKTKTGKTKVTETETPEPVVETPVKEKTKIDRTKTLDPFKGQTP